jgi:predicted DNA-binding protein
MRLSDQIAKRTEKFRDAALFKTTSFTLLKADYTRFKSACKKLNRKPSVVLRELVTMFINDCERNAK